MRFFLGFTLAAGFAVATQAHDSCPPKSCDRDLTALVAPKGATPDALDYDAILDRAVLWERDTKDVEHRKRLEEAIALYRDPTGRDALELRTVYGLMAGHWLRNASGYVESRSDWTFAEKVQAFREFARRIQQRSIEPVSQWPVWFAEEHAAKDGSVVFAGTDHRLLVRNAPGAPMYKGRIPEEERHRIARAGSLKRYYDRWEPTDLAAGGLEPVKSDDGWR